MNRIKRTSFSKHAERIIIELQQSDRPRTAQTYQDAFRRFARFVHPHTIKWEHFTPDLIHRYELHLHRDGLSRNTSSYYLRNLRALYNRAVRLKLCRPGNPFEGVYTGVEKTQKRAISAHQIRMICELDLPKLSDLDFARDLFLFSFLTHGMSFIDMAYLRKSNIKHNCISYIRRKTGRSITVHLFPEIHSIIRKYADRDSPYLLPIISEQAPSSPRQQYLTLQHYVNRKLHIIGKMIHLKSPLTMYVARHSWASIAHEQRVPIGIISQAMGHDSESTTRIYLTELSTSTMGKADAAVRKAISKPKPRSSGSNLTEQAVYQLNTLT